MAGCRGIFKNCKVEAAYFFYENLDNCSNNIADAKGLLIGVKLAIMLKAPDDRY
jgi:hypothetical protein